MDMILKYGFNHALGITRRLEEGLICQKLFRTIIDAHYARCKLVLHPQFPSSESSVAGICHVKAFLQVGKRADWEISSGL